MQHRFHSDGLARTLFCLLAGLTTGYVGGIVGSFVGGLSFPPLPQSGRAENAALVFASILFLLFGAGGVRLCRRLTGGWPPGEPGYQNVGILLSSTRWLAIGTGCLAGAAGFLSGSFLPALLLISGALTQSRLQRTGFWLMLAPAMFLSFWMFPLGCLLFLDSLKAPAYYHDSTAAMFESLWAASLVLLVWCDTALIREGLRLKLF